MFMGSRSHSLCVFASLMVLCNISCFQVYNRQIKRKVRLSLDLPSTISAPILDKEAMAEAEELLEAGKRKLGLQTDNPAEFTQLTGSIFESALHDKNELNESLLAQDGIEPGEQLLALSGDGKGLHVDALVNITENNEEFTSLGNSSVAADVFEMVMEKAIPGGKGKPQGKQEIRIVQMDQIKPLSNEDITAPSVIKKRGIYNGVAKPKLRTLHIVKRMILNTKNQKLKKDAEWAANPEEDYQQVETSPTIHDAAKTKTSSTEIGDLFENVIQNTSLPSMLDVHPNKKGRSSLHLNYFTADKKHTKNFIENDQEYTQSATNEKPFDEDSSQVYSPTSLLPNSYTEENWEDNFVITRISEIKGKQHSKKFMTSQLSKQYGDKSVKATKTIKKTLFPHKIDAKNAHVYKENEEDSEAINSLKNHGDRFRIFIISIPYRAYHPRKTDFHPYRNHFQRKHHKSSKPFFQNKLINSIRNVKKDLALINNLNDIKEKHLPHNELEFEIYNESISNDPQTWKISKGHHSRRSKKILNISDLLNLDILKQKLFMKSDIKSVEKIVVENKGENESLELIFLSLILLLGITLIAGTLIMYKQYEPKTQDRRNINIQLEKYRRQLTNSFGQMGPRNHPKQIEWPPKLVKRNDLKLQHFAAHDQEEDSGSQLEWQSENGEWLSDNDSKERVSRSTSFTELSRNRQIK